MYTVELCKKKKRAPAPCERNNTKDHKRCVCVSRGKQTKATGESSRVRSFSSVQAGVITAAAHYMRRAANLAVGLSCPTERGNH